METTIKAEFTLEEVQFILKCLKTYPFQLTVEAMPQVCGMVNAIARKMTPSTSPLVSTSGEMIGDLNERTAHDDSNL